jgi:hypothetical protein
MSLGIMKAGGGVIRRISGKKSASNNFLDRIYRRL